MNAVGSIRKWLTFGLSEEQEDRFPQANFGADIAQARICIFLISLILVAFAATDYTLLGFSWSFYVLLTLRLALVAYTILLLKNLSRLTNYRSYDRTEFIWGLLIAFFNLAVMTSRPIAFVAHIIVVVLSVFLTVLAVPNRFTGRVHELLIDSEKSSTSHVFEKNIERF